MNIDTLKYPIGKFVKPLNITRDILKQWIADITSFPSRLDKEVSQLSDTQLDTPYRPEGWTLRQVVHHCADSHLNAFTRLKLTLTEDSPTVKPYYEERWAELIDSKTFPIESSIKILQGIHTRWVAILHSLTDQDLQRIFIHPEHGRQFKLEENVGIYAWHGNHHLAHITTLKKLENWS